MTANITHAREELAREELTEIVSNNLPQWVYEATDKDDWIEVADAILDALPKLGYVKSVAADAVVALMQHQPEENQ